MSAIAGIIHTDGAPVAPQLVERMTAAMAVRGPDGITHWNGSGVALGHCMLRTTPESAEEVQPLASEDASVVLVIDGRVDNWEELRKELLAAGAHLRTRADAELVLRAYQTWGRDFLAHVDGDFALALWDNTQRTLLCARDRIGHRQLHYHWNGQTFSFATELQALLLLPWVPKETNVGIIVEYLALEMLSPDETLWQGILRLQPARCMELHDGRLAQRRYWQPDLWQTLPCRSDADHVEYYRELFADVVRRQSRSTGPLACEVSGGIDSSAIYAMAEHLHARQALLAPGVQGYTLGFREPGDANELEFSHAVGRFWGREIREVAPTRKPLDWYRAAAAHLQQFAGWPNGIMLHDLRLRVLRDGSRTLLVGAGGDEWLGGSRAYYAEALATGKFRELFHCLRTDWRSAGAAKSMSWLLFSGLLPLLPREFRRLLRAAERAVNFRGTWCELWLTPELRQLLRQRRRNFLPPPQPPVRRIGQRGQLNMLGAAYYLEGLEIEELTTAQLGLELRRPLLHPSIIQFAFASPERLRQEGTLDRALHRRAMAGLLPEAILQRTSKADFSATVEWMLPEVRAWLGRESAGANPEWVRKQSLAAMLGPGKIPGDEGWARWMLWTLFCCAAMIHTDQPEP